MNIAIKAAMSARAARVIPTPTPAFAAGLSPTGRYLESEDAVSTPLEAVGVGLKSALDGVCCLFAVLVLEVFREDVVVDVAVTLDDDEEEPVICFQSSGETAENVVSVTVPLHPPSPQHIHSCVESSH